MGNSPLSSLFGKSPFKPLQKHMRLVTECASQVPGLLEALGGKDQAKSKELTDTIFRLEHEADVIKRELMTRLPKSLFLPIDRRDLVELLNVQDNIAGTAQDIARVLLSRTMDVPVGMGEPLIALARRCVDACEKAALIIEELDELVQMGFAGLGSNKVLVMVDELEAIEHETDDMAAELARSLFAHEGEMQPVAVIIWHQLIGLIADLADNAEKAGGHLRLLTAR